MTGITTLSAQHCNQGTQVSILAKAETFECLCKKRTGKEFPSSTVLLAGQAPVSGHLSPTPLVAAYENHFRKQPAPVTDMSCPEGVC